MNIRWTRRIKINPWLELFEIVMFRKIYMLELQKVEIIGEKLSDWNFSKQNMEERRVIGLCWCSMELSIYKYLNWRK